MLKPIYSLTYSKPAMPCLNVVATLFIFALLAFQRICAAPVLERDNVHLRETTKLGYIDVKDMKTLPKDYKLDVGHSTP